MGREIVIKRISKKVLEGGKRIPLAEETKIKTANYYAQGGFYGKSCKLFGCDASFFISSIEDEEYLVVSFVIEKENENILAKDISQRFFEIIDTMEKIFVVIDYVDVEKSDPDSNGKNKKDHNNDKKNKKNFFYIVCKIKRERVERILSREKDLDLEEVDER